MNNKLYDFEQKHLDFVGEHYIGYKDKEGTHKPYYGDDIHYLSINPDVIKLLNNTDLPKKLQYLKLPYNQIFIPNKLSFGEIVLPNGFFVSYGFDNEIGDLDIEEGEFDKIMMKQVDGEKLTTEEENVFMHSTYYIGFYYISNKGEGFVVFKISDIFAPYKEAIWETSHYDRYVPDMDNEEYNNYIQEVWEEAGGIKQNNDMIKDFNLVELSEFIYKLLLFIDCPDVEIRKTEGRAKKFRKNGYDFFEPKKLYSELSHDLRKYIQEIKNKYGVKFNYKYKYIVRGHFRTMNHNRYKKNNTIWIKPYFKGKGKYVSKEKIVCRNI